MAIYSNDGLNSLIQSNVGEKELGSFDPNTAGPEELDKFKFFINWDIGEKVLFHGIYSCTGCSNEVALSKDSDGKEHKFPPHPSNDRCEKVAWKLLVYSEGYKQ